MNSAERLHSLLSAAMRYQGGTARHVWSRALNVSKDDSAAVLLGVGQILQLLGQVEREVRGLGLDASEPLEDLKKIKDAFRAFNLDEQWNRAKSRFDVTSIHALTYIARGLPGVAGAAEVPTSTLDELRKQLEQLVAAIVRADIDSELKQSTLDYLDYARRALLEYRISGAEGLRRALDLNLALLLRYRETAKSSSSVGSAFAKVWSFLAKLDTALSLSGYGTQLSPQVTALIGDVVSKLSASS